MKDIPKKINSGKYVIAVSGGVDSMSLLHMLANQPGTELIVAHFNHGIRKDSALDEVLVRKAAKKYNLAFEVGYGRLGADASEEQARDARYKFLDKVKLKHGAQAIITAHHQDDLIETAFLNILRGTGRLGLAPMSNATILRPLLGVPRQEIVEYAKKNELEWREDASNTDTRYGRNYLRQKVLPKLTEEQREKMVKNIDKVASINIELNQSLATLSQTSLQTNNLNRARFASLPSEVACELMAHWLRQNGLRDFDKKTLERVSMAIRTAQPNTRHKLLRRYELVLTKKTAHFTTPE